MQSEEEQAIKMSIELNKHRAKDLAANLPPGNRGSDTYD